MPPLARLLFIGLFSNADDQGRMRANARFVHGRIFPYDDTADVDTAGLLLQLHDGGFIQIYSVDGSEFLQILGWTRHQKIDKPSPSSHPCAPSAQGIVSVSVDAGSTRETSCRYRDHAKCEHLSGDALIPESQCQGQVSVDAGFMRETSCRCRDHAKCEHLSGDALATTADPSQNSVEIPFDECSSRPRRGFASGGGYGSGMDMEEEEEGERATEGPPVSVRSVSVSGEPESKAAMQGTDPLAQCQGRVSVSGKCPDPSGQVSVRSVSVSVSGEPESKAAMQGTDPSVSGEMRGSGRSDPFMTRKCGADAVTSFFNGLAPPGDGHEFMLTPVGPSSSVPFRPPERTEVDSWFASKLASNLAEGFWKHYSGNSWTVGKPAAPMCDWTLAAESWLERQRGSPAPTDPKRDEKRAKRPEPYQHPPPEGLRDRLR